MKRFKPLTFLIASCCLMVSSVVGCVVSCEVKEEDAFVKFTWYLHGVKGGEMTWYDEEVCDLFDATTVQLWLDEDDDNVTDVYFEFNCKDGTGVTEEAWSSGEEIKFAFGLYDESGQLISQSEEWETAVLSAGENDLEKVNFYIGDYGPLGVDIEWADKTVDPAFGGCDFPPDTVSKMGYLLCEGAQTGDDTCDTGTLYDEVDIDTNPGDCTSRLDWDIIDFGTYTLVIDGEDASGSTLWGSSCEELVVDSMIPSSNEFTCQVLMTEGGG